MQSSINKTNRTCLIIIINVLQDIDDDKLQKDEKLMDFIDSTTTALLATKDSKCILRLLLTAYFAKEKVHNYTIILNYRDNTQCKFHMQDGNSEGTNEWETLSSATWIQSGDQVRNIEASVI